MDTVVIIGGGHAAAQLCAALAEGGYGGRIVLVSEERHRPYHRPPLSKALIKDPAAALPELRGAVFYDKAGIVLKLATQCVSIDRAARRVLLRPHGAASAAHDEVLAYDHLVLATGARPRRLPGVPDGAPNVHTLRNYDDALRLRDALPATQHLLVVGGGFIGLELAATARALGKQVTLIEAAPRLLARAVSEAVSEHLLASHRAAGVDLRLGRPPEALHFDATDGSGRFTGATLDGEHVAADQLIVGIGATPETGLAAGCGLPCDNGIVVDALMATADPQVSAIGDCTAFPYGAQAQPLRLESVQNANDQAKALAARLLGQPQPYAPVPWFWSEQGEVRLQIAGLWRPGLQAVRREGTRPGSFSLAHYGSTAGGDVLVAVESINAPQDHMNAKRWLQQQHSPAPAAWADAARPLKEL